MNYFSECLGVARDGVRSATELDGESRGYFRVRLFLDVGLRPSLLVMWLMKGFWPALKYIDVIKRRDIFINNISLSSFQALSFKVFCVI